MYKSCIDTSDGMYLFPHYATCMIIDTKCWLSHSSHLCLGLQFHKLVQETHATYEQRVLTNTLTLYAGTRIQEGQRVLLLSTPTHV